MLSIAIDRFTTRYRMPAAALRQQPRVQRIVNDVLERVLEGAIEREGIGQSEYVCVRDVDAVTTLRLREVDSALAVRVGDAIVTAIRQRLEEGSTAVVKYGSRVHALIDLASSATAGDFSRSWAWAQLGMWRSDVPLRAHVAAELVLRALVKEPAHATAVIAYLARERTDRFRDLIARATPDAWGALAHAAMVAAGGPGARTARTAAAAVTRQAIDPAPQMPASSIAARVLIQSRIARASMERSAASAMEIRAALAALALLEVEPSAVRSADVAQLLAAIQHAIGPGAPDARSRTQAAGTDAVSLEDAAGEKPAANARHSTHPSREHDAQPARNEEVRAALDPRTTSGEPFRAGQADGAAGDGRSRIDGERAASPETIDRAIAGRPSSAGDREGDPVPDVRGVTRTAHGGLLYLVNLLPRMGLVDAMRDDSRWSDRGLRWVLHQLAMALAAIDPDDPAALVFAGLMPGAPPPSSLQDSPTELELAALGGLRAEIARALRAAVGDVPGSDSRLDRALLDHVCRRPAQIVAEPGWIEVRFPLEDASIDIRRAGLDRDPDWVPWLGVVVRFIYG